MRCLVPVSALLIGLAGPVAAAPVTYTFEGQADFFFGELEFNNASFTVVATGDTNDITGSSGLFSVPVSAFFDTSAVGRDFQADIQVVLLPDDRRVGIADDGLDARVTGRNDLLQAYTLDQSIGPIDLDDIEIDGEFQIGDFRFDAGTFDDVTFEAQVVPLPATAPLLLAGLGALAVWRQRSRSERHR